MSSMSSVWMWPRAEYFRKIRERSVRVGPALAGAACAALLASCASTLDAPASEEATDMRSVELRRGKIPRKFGSEFDSKGGRCPAGTRQFLTLDEFDALRSDWLTPSAPAVCTGPEIGSTPATAGYPSRLAALGRSGSAQVLVRIEPDGRVESVHAVCASDVPFADAAVATAMSIRFTPMECSGAKVRSAVLLPLSYAWP